MGMARWHTGRIEEGGVPHHSPPPQPPSSVAAVVFARWKNQLNFMQMSAGCEGGREGGRKEGAEKRGKRDKIQVGIVDKFVLSYFEIFIRQTKWVEDMLTTEF